MLAEQNLSKTLFIYGTLKAVFVALFLFSFFHIDYANAAEDYPCAGSDLISRFEKSDPELLVKLHEDASKTVYGSSRFWRISKAGIPDSWLFGTMHVTGNSVVSLPTAAQEAFDNSNTVLVEITEIADKKKLVETIRKIKHLIYRQDGKTIASEISTSQMAQLKTAINARSLPFEVTIRMQPWMLGPAITRQVCEVKAKKAGKLFLDAKIMQMASKQNKTLIGLETMGEQLQIMADMPREFHIASLTQSLALGERLDDLKKTMKNLYLQGQIGMIVPLIRHISSGFSNSEQNAQFLSKMVSQRNVRMIERAKEYFARGNVFMAVGALHLPGEKGLAALLESQGYTISALGANVATD